MKTFKLKQSPFRINEWQLVKDEFHEVRLALSGPDYLMLTNNQTFEINRDEIEPLQGLMSVNSRNRQVIAFQFPVYERTVQITGNPHVSSRVERGYFDFWKNRFRSLDTGGESFVPTAVDISESPHYIPPDRANRGELR